MQRRLPLRHPDDAIPTGSVVELQFEQTASLGLLEQVVEGAEPVERLVESRTTALERLFDHRSPQLGPVTAL